MPGEKLPWDWDRFKALAESAGFKARRDKQPDGLWWQVMRGRAEVAHVSVNDLCCAFHVNQKRSAAWDSTDPADRPFRQDEFDEMFSREFAQQIADHAAKQRPDPVKSYPLTIDKAVRLSELLQRYAKELLAVYGTLDEINATSAGES